MRKTTIETLSFTEDNVAETGEYRGFRYLILGPNAPYGRYFMACEMPDGSCEVGGGWESVEEARNRVPGAIERQLKLQEEGGDRYPFGHYEGRMRI